MTEQKTHFGRYQLVRLLGQGAEGAVWLAHDPLTMREVAIKSLRTDQGLSASRLLGEARLLCRLKHPNLVTLYDVLEDDGQVGLVLEYVTGETLERRIQQQGQLSPVQAVRYIVQVLEALVVAHAQGIWHRDIKPANILLTDDDQVRLADFGVAGLIGEQPGQIVGTREFVAPEFLRGETAGANADVFSVGVTLFEMLAGRPVVTGEHIHQVWFALLTQRFQSPSHFNHRVDAQLDDIVLKALFKHPSERYDSAQALLNALRAWESRGQNLPSLADGQASAVEFLLRRMEMTSDFPGLSASISRINHISGEGNQSVRELASAILKDFALTNKLLRLVNSASYGQFRGKVSTVSRATMILGVNAIRQLAMGLMLVEHLQNRVQERHLKQEILYSFMTGQLAKKVAGSLGCDEEELAFVCGLFHSLGRLLSAYYFHDESLVIARRRQQGESEEKASRDVLGVGYCELGVKVAHKWALPDELVFSLDNWPEKVPARLRTTEDRLRTIAELASRLMDMISTEDHKRYQQKGEEISRRFGHLLSLRPIDIETLLKHALAEMLVEAPYYGIQAQEKEVLRLIRHVTGLDVPPTHKEEALFVKHSTIPLEPETLTGQDRLVEGLQDLSAAVMEGASLRTLAHLLMETLLAGTPFQRILLFLPASGEQRLIVRQAHGIQVEAIVDQMTLTIGPELGVLTPAFRDHQLQTLEDLMQTGVPPWLASTLQSRSCLLMPFCLQGRLNALVVADSPKPVVFQLDDATRPLLETLRNLLLLGAKQKKAPAAPK